MVRSLSQKKKVHECSETTLTHDDEKNGKDNEAH